MRHRPRIVSPEREELEYLAAVAGLREAPSVQQTIDVAVATGDRELQESIREYLLSQVPANGLRDNPFLPGPGQLPPGEITIGTVIGGDERATFELPLSYLDTHVLITGATGAGKSMLLKYLITQMIDSGISVWVFDIEREYTSLASLFGPDELVVLDVADFKRNPLEVLTGETPTEVITRMKNLSYEQYLRNGSLNLQDEVLKGLFEDHAAKPGPTYADYYQLLKKMKFRAGSRQAGYLESLLNRATGIINNLQNVYDCVEGFDLRELMTTSMILRCPDMEVDVLRFFINDLISAVISLRSSQQTSTQQLLVLALDEAHLLIPPRSFRSGDREPLMCDHIRRVRKRHMGLILSDQTPSQLPNTVLGNMSTRIVMRLLDGYCKETMGRSMALDLEQEAYLSELPARCAVVQYPGCAEAFMIEIPEISLPPAPDGADLRRAMEPKLRALYEKVKVKEKAGEDEKESAKQRVLGFPVPGQPPLEKAAVDYLQDIANRPFVMATERDAALGLSSWKGNDVREQLLARELVRKQKVNTGRRGGVITLLEVTDAGYELLESLGVKGAVPAGKGSFEHRFWQYQIVGHLREKYAGCEPVIEDFRFGKAVDVGVKIEDRWVAVEIGLTGLDKELTNIRKDLEVGYGEVWVGCLSKKDRDRLKRTAQEQLPAGLLDRVQFKLLADFWRSNDNLEEGEADKWIRKRGKNEVRGREQ